MSTGFAKQGRRRGRQGRATMALAVLVSLSVACSDSALLDLGGRSSGWIGEVATTVPSTTTSVPEATRPSAQVNWANDELGEAPPPDAEPSDVLAQVFARTGGESRFLQASRAEIAAVTPEVEFPAEVAAGVFYVTSQLVTESRTLRLANEPTVAFGMWSVEPYTRSRSIGQLAVLNVSTDAAAAEVANDPNTAPTCTAFSQVENRVCGIETFAEIPVWRLETENGVVHLWYTGSFRYELSARSDVDEEVLHEMVMAMAPLADQIPGA